ncbi:MAG: hypothetical protein HY907_08315 [Deltaproteobacteria bacterium]|nr:hypothetical protein [Deltaproteobacteria bacterium]
MRRFVMLLAVAVVAIGAFWMVGVGCGDDDSGTPTCTSALCAAGSAACCTGAVRGVWNTSLRRCVCGTADADADVDVAADGDADVTPEVETETGPDADADVPVDEGGGGCVGPYGGSCDPVLQCGCAAGERCILQSETGAPPYTETCFAAGTDTIDTECPAGADNCAPQMQCFGDGTTFNCTMFCYGDTDCPSGRPCQVPPSIEPLGFCGPAAVDCDPFTGTGCTSSENCDIMDFTTCDRACGPTGTGTAGEDCGTTGCVSGYGCLTTTGGPPYSCMKYCNPSGTPNCSDVPGTTCQTIGAGTCAGFGICMAG